MLCRLSVRTHEGVWQEEVDSWTGLVVLAALSAEPESLAELTEAMRRYQPEHRWFEAPRGATADEVEADGPWCLVDLPGRTVVAGNGFELPDQRGAYEADKDEETNGFSIVWLDTPPDWLFREAGDDWRAVVADRWPANPAALRVDARAVLFGPPLLDHLADGVLAADTADWGDAHLRELTRAVHARWLMTAQADLGGRTPREVLLADRNRLDRELEHRRQQWSLQRHAVPPLSTASAAYRFAGFTITEVVLYFDLVRTLLAEAWAFRRHEPERSRLELVEHLSAYRDYWLRQPHEGGSSGLTPAELIESARRRLPVTGHGPIDDDCPLCQAQAEGMFGPMFLHFDGHHLEMEDEFAFSLCKTRKEWEREQEEYQRFSEEMDRKRCEEQVTGAEAADPFAGSVWQRSFVDWDRLPGADGSPAYVLLALGFPLAELVSDLKGRQEGEDLARRVNEAYAGMRTSQDAVAVASVAQEFREALEAVGRAFPDVTAKSADLQSRVDEALRRIT